jgi:uncharacterized protein
VILNAGATRVTISKARSWLFTIASCCRIYLRSRQAHGRAVYRDAIASHLDAYMGEWFEVICRQWVRFYSTERLPAVAQTVGKIWASDYDIDVAGELLDGTRVAGECRWRRDATGANVLRELQTRVAGTPFYADPRSKTIYLIFSRSPMTTELRRLNAEGKSGVMLGSSELIGGRRGRAALTR